LYWYTNLEKFDTIGKNINIGMEKMNEK